MGEMADELIDIAFGEHYDEHYAASVEAEAGSYPFGYPDPQSYWDDLEEVSVIHETPKARLMEHKGKQAWFPKSISNVDEDASVMEYQSWFIPDWRKK